MMDQRPADAPAPRGRQAELTWTAVLLGIVLSVVMGAANVYLGLRVGMTVSASIPAAVIAMGILHGAMRRRSILEANMVQTSASAGESLAAGIIFTMPALVITEIWQEFDFWTTTLVAMSGGLLGILLMIPMRRAFIVNSPELTFPEGLACAEVLRAGEGEEQGCESAESGTLLVFLGLAVGAAVKFAAKFFGLFKSVVSWATVQQDRVFYFGTDTSAALLGVGFIVGLPIAVQIFMGGAIGWLVILPILGGGSAEGPPVDQAFGLWSAQIRYVGVGAMVVGGIVSIWKVRGGLVSAAREMWQQFGRQMESSDDDPRERNISGAAVGVLTVVCLVMVAGIYSLRLHLPPGITTLVMPIVIVMAVFFTAVASYIVGLVGNSNSPVSGMTITTVLATGALIALFGYTGEFAIVATLGVAGVVCCVACTSGDVCNDLKTGHLVGASPRNQQVMQVIGVFVAAFVMAPVLTVLHHGSIEEGTGGIGGSELTAPQAKLFASLVNGFFGDGELPWNMVVIGAGLGCLLVAADFILATFKSEFRLHVMPVAVGMYLPLDLSVPILLGGVLRSLVKRRDPPGSGRGQKRGVLIASGVIAGESLVGVALGVVAFFQIKSFSLGEDYFGRAGYDAASLAALFGVAAWILWLAGRRSASS